MHTRHADGVVDDIGYGRQFDGWYDRVYPKDQVAEEAAEKLAQLHPAPEAGTLEFGVGTGRVAIPLAARVGPVVGVDSSLEMLAGLRADAEAGLVEPVHGDMRAFRDDRRFALVYCVCGTLSMVLDPVEQRRVIERAAELLVPGGLLVVETHDPATIEAMHDGRARETFFFPYPEPGTGLQMHSVLSSTERIWRCSHIWYESDGTTRVGSELSRLTHPHEVDAYGLEAGLTPESRLGSWDGRPYAGQAPTYICTYRKP